MLRAMDVFVLSMAALSALAPSPVVPDPAMRTHNAGQATARRSPDGATAMANVTVRIISRPAKIGPRHGPPLPDMVPRAATIAAADGSPVAALIYDFE